MDTLGQALSSMITEGTAAPAPQSGITGRRELGVKLPDLGQRPVLSAIEAFALLGIDRTTGYRAIQEGTFPVEVIRVGHLLKVPTLALARLLLGAELKGSVTVAS